MLKTQPLHQQQNIQSDNEDWAPPPTLDITPAAVGCRFCGATLRETVVDLGMSPLCQSHVQPHEATASERFYPLRAFVCHECFLVQVQEHVPGEDIFSDYAYFSSYSDSWLRHAEHYADSIIPRLGLTSDSQVIEVASNDGYLLQFFNARGIPSLGIEPAANVARAAEEKGVRSVVKFFGTKTAQELVNDGITADLLIGNNVLAHVPNLNDFVAGLKVLLGPSGVITIEFPHLMNLIELNQFDTIYQEHYCYFSLFVLERVFAHYGLTIFDVDEIPTHGGSLRIYARHDGDDSRPVSKAVTVIRERELAAGYDTIARYRAFGEQVAETKRKLLSFLIEAKRDDKQVVGYGAPGKGSTLLNYCGVRQDFVDYTVDRNPVKQNTYMPGTRIPIFAPDKIKETRPDYVLILPWNLKDEIMDQLSYIRDWGGQFLVPIPEMAVYP